MIYVLYLYIYDIKGYRIVFINSLKELRLLVMVVQEWLSFMFPERIARVLKIIEFFFWGGDIEDVRIHMITYAPASRGPGVTISGVPSKCLATLPFFHFIKSTLAATFNSHGGVWNDNPENYWAEMTTRLTELILCQGSWGMTQLN